jgi:tetratricopeptide (TPR) repeat protein
MREQSLDSASSVGPDAGALPPVDASARGLFVGRAQELAVLRAAVDDAIRGRGRSMLVVGDPGIGKTRLCDEVSRYAGSCGARVLWGSCWEGGGAPAYWPWVQALRGHIRDTDPQRLAAQLGDAASDVARIIPELCTRLPGVASPLPSEADNTRFRTFDATTEFLARAAAETPLVIILDDLQVADEPSLLLLTFVCRSLQWMRVLIVGAHRPILSDDRLALFDQLARDSQHLQLTGLDAAEIELLVEAGAASTGLTLRPSRLRSLADAIHSVTQGNPFFIDAVLRLLASDNRLAGEQLPIFGRFSTPHEIRTAVHRRLQALSAEGRELLQAAAVLGRDLDLRLLERLAPTPSMHDLLDEAARAGIIVSSQQRDAAYSFSHVLICDTIYGGLQPRWRGDLHRGTAQALEQLYGADPDRSSLIAHHFFAAASDAVDAASRRADLQRAATYAARAGERAEAMLAYEEAASCYECALEAVSLSDSDPRRRCELFLALGGARRKADDGVRSRAAYLQAADIARHLIAAHEPEAGELLARASLGLGTKGFWGTLPAGEVDELLIGILEESVAALGPLDSALRAQALACLALALYWVFDQRSRCVALSAESVAIAKRLGDPLTQLMCWASHRMATWTADNVRERYAAATEALRLARDVGHREISLFAYGMRISDAIEVGDFETARQDVAGYARVAQELRQPQYAWWLTGLHMMLALVEGRLAEGEALAIDMLAKGQGARADDAARVFVMTQFSIRRDRGGLEELAEMPEVTSEQFRAFPVWRAGIALLLAEIGRPIEAQQELNFLAADDFRTVLRDSAWLCCVAMLAETAALLRDLPRAASLYDQLLGCRDSVVVLGFGFGTWGSLSRHLGVLATVLSRWREAAQHFECALRVNERMGARPCLARTQIDYGAMLLMRGENGDRPRAEALLRTALDITRECGMHRLGKHAQRVLRQSRAADTASDRRGGQEVGVSSSDAESADVFRFDGDYWTVGNGERTFHLADSKGMRCIHHLLANPGREFHAVELAALIGRQRTRRPGDAPMQFTSPASERARVNVTRLIAAAIRRIRADEPELGRRLATSIKTGTFCSYTPAADPRSRWEL